MGHSLPIYYGEFGCTNTQTHATGRDAWFQAHAAMIATKGWAASVWNDGGGHLLYNYDSGAWVEEILDDIGKGSSPIPPPPPTPPPPACRTCGYMCNGGCNFCKTC